MPTANNAEAFAKLVAARTRLNEITRQLNEANANLSVRGIEANRRYAELQKEWDAAYRDFVLATERLSDVAKSLPTELRDIVQNHLHPHPGGVKGD